MSQSTYNNIYSESSTYTFSDSIKVPKNIIKGSWVPRSPCIWTSNIQMRLVNFFKNLSYPYRQYEDIPFEDPLRSEIRRFLISLDAYLDSPNPVISPNYLLMGSTMPDFSDKLKKIKRKAFETSWFVELFDTPEWWDEIPTYKINDIGDIFNYSYLIWWETPIEDDYLYGDIPVVQDQKYLDLFREHVRNILPDRELFEKIDKFEILSKLSSSISFDGRKKSPHYKLKKKFLRLSKKRRTSVRSIIRVSVENTRDSCISQPDDLNTISLIDSQLLEILRFIPNHIHLRDKDEVNRRLASFRDSFTFFLQRDIKKEGITKPRTLLKIMLEELHDEYPDIEVFGYTDFYDNYSLQLEDGTVRYMKRGTGLGMANALTTLMQVAIHNMVIDKILDDIGDVPSECLALNDDFVVGLNDTYHLDCYWEAEDEIMQGLSIIREPKKSFSSINRFVIAERYFFFEIEHKKVSYQLRELLLPLACYNISHAKEYFSAAQTFVESKFVPWYMKDILSYWGYEFYPEEYKYPVIFGGWQNQRLYGIDLSLYIIEDLPIKSYIFRGFKASKVKHKKRRKNLGDIISSPCSLLYGNPSIPERFYDSFDMLSSSQLTEKYGRVLKGSVSIFEKYWSSYYSNRQKVFKKDFDITFDELILLVKDTYKTTEFYPCRQMIKRFHEFDIIQNNIKDIYIDPNPKLSLISKYNNTKYPFAESYSIQFTEPDNFTQKTSSLYPKDIERNLKNQKVALNYSSAFDDLYIPKNEDYKPHYQYICPIRIGRVAAHLDWGMGYPEIHKRFEDSLIKEKEEIFGEILSIREQNLLTNYKVSRENIKTLVQFRSETGQDFETIISFILKNIKYIAKESSFEIEEIEKNEIYEGNELSYHVLMENPQLFWQWRQDRKEFSFTDEISEPYLKRLDWIVISLSPMIHVQVTMREDVDRFMTSLKDAKLRLLIERTGVLATGSTSIFDEVFSADDGGVGIFGDEDY